MIRPVTPDDAAAIIHIYNHYVTTTAISFEMAPVSEAEMRQRILSYSAQFPWLVYEEAGQVLGYCYATPWKARAAYAHSVESSVYVDKACHARGIGAALYRALLAALASHPVHLVVAGITLPNEKSQRLHEKLGFQQVAHFAEIGRKQDQWQDVGYWALRLPSP